MYMKNIIPALFLSISSVQGVVDINISDIDQNSNVIYVNQGWNLISAPNQTSGSFVDFYTLGSYEYIWQYQNAQWRAQGRTGDASNRLEVNQHPPLSLVDNATAFWVNYPTADEIITLSGTSYDTNYSSLAEGWNLVGAGQELIGAAYKDEPRDIKVYRSAEWVLDPLKIDEGEGYYLFHDSTPYSELSSTFSGTYFPFITAVDYNTSVNTVTDEGNLKFLVDLNVTDHPSQLGEGLYVDGILKGMIAAIESVSGTSTRYTLMEASSVFDVFYEYNESVTGYNISIPDYLNTGSNTFSLDISLNNLDYNTAWDTFNIQTAGEIGMALNVSNFVLDVATSPQEVTLPQKKFLSHGYYVIIKPKLIIEPLNELEPLSGTATINTNISTLLAYDLSLKTGQSINSDSATINSLSVTGQTTNVKAITLEFEIALHKKALDTSLAFPIITQHASAIVYEEFSRTGVTTVESTHLSKQVAVIVEQYKVFNDYEETPTTAPLVVGGLVTSALVVPTCNEVFASTENLAGTVTLTRDGVTTTADANTVFREGDIVASGTRSFIKIRFADGSKISVGAKSRVTIEPFQTQSGGVLSTIKGVIRQSVHPDKSGKYKTRTGGGAVRG